MWKSTLIILFGVFVMGSLTVYIVNQSPTMKETLKAERPVERDVLVHLFAFPRPQKSDDKHPQVNIDQTKQLIFEVSTNVPIYVALLIAGRNERPDILLSDAKVPPGQGKHLRQSVERFVFSAPKNNAKNKFCLIYGTSLDELSMKLRRLSQVWPQIPKTQCVTA